MYGYCCWQEWPVLFCDAAKLKKPLIEHTLLFKHYVMKRVHYVNQFLPHSSSQNQLQVVFPAQSQEYNFFAALKPYLSILPLKII